MGDHQVGPPPLSGMLAQAHAAALATAGMHGATALAALLVAATPGLDDSAAHALAFRFDPRPGTAREAAEIFTANARVASAILLLGVGANRRLFPAPAARLLAAGLLALNAVVVGAAIGAYGIASTAAWLVHLPLEWAALGVSAATLTPRPQAPTPARAAAIAAPILVAAAAMETYGTPLEL